MNPQWIGRKIARKIARKNIEGTKEVLTTADTDNKRHGAADIGEA